MAEGYGHLQAKIDGLDQLRRALRTLPVEVEKNVLGRAVAKGADVIRDEAIAKAPVLDHATRNRKPGTLKRAIYAVVGRRGSDSAATAFVGIRKLSARAIARFKARGGSGAQNPDDAFYWRFIEFGTSKMRAMPFLRPAFDAKKEAAAQAIKDELSKGVEDEAAKLAWRL